MIAKSAQRALLVLCITFQWSLVLAFPEPHEAEGGTSGGNTGMSGSAPAPRNTTKPANGNATSTKTPDPKAAAKAAARAAVRAREKREDRENWAIVRAFVYIWVSLAALFILATAFVVVRRYIRTVSSLSPGNTQNYFVPVNRYWGLLKKHFIFAPLFHKRHHRAFMLTRTIDNGCLPSRPQTFMLVSYFIFLMVATFYGVDYKQNKYDVIASIERRSGLFALSHLLILIILAARHDPILYLTDISFDTLNLFHRWIGRFVVCEIVIHVSTYFAKKIPTEGWAGYKHTMATLWFTRAGTITALCIFIIFFQTCAPIRHRFYEFFLHLHQALVAVVLWGVWTHMEGYPSRRRLILGMIGVWVAERSLRLIRIIYRNLGKPITTAEIEVMSDIAMRVKVRLTRPWTFTPGQHAYLYVPSVGWWTAHPFSVAWTDEDIEDNISEKDSLPRSIDDIASRKRNIYFLIRRMKGFTNDLYTATQKAGGKLKTTALVEGPYNRQTLHSYGTVVLVAAGIGITHIVPHVHDLVRGYGTGSVAARRILMIWSVRTIEELELIRDWMTIILALPKRQEVLRIMIYVFQLDKTELDLPSNTIQVFPGIAKFEPIMDEEVKNSVGSIGVCVCGIGVVADEMRYASRKWMDKVNIEFMEESFSW